MKRLFCVFILFFCIIVTICSQNHTQQDSLTIMQDSIDVLTNKLHILQNKVQGLQDSIAHSRQNKTEKQIKRERVIGSLFGQSKQLSNADSLLRAFDNEPSFGMYKDNYIVTGTELFHRTDKWNSDAKFQVSIRQRLTNSVLPFKTHIFLTYTQKAFWDIYRESFPFRDLNFNPTIGIGRPLVHNNRLLGLIDMQFEHESNGKDQDASRSWNKVSFNAILIFRDRWIFQSKMWIPIVDGNENRDIVSYAGYGLFALTYSSLKKKYNVSCVLTKRSAGFFNANITMNFSVRLFNNEDIYLFAEYYDGYGESMLDYKEYRRRIRGGISLKTNLFSIF